VIPGASAVLTALLYSGFTSSRFAFDGFLPRTEVSLEKYLRTLEQEERTVVTFESPKRLVRSLQVAVRVLGKDRNIAVCREMTKTYEEVFRGTVESALSWAMAREAGEGIKGEITLVFSPLESRSDPSVEEIRERAKELFEDGLSSKEISIRIASEFTISKRDAYDLANSLRNSKEDN
jgi:16S rRNA (cytidine1402-2'-O)-methyltransferase